MTKPANVTPISADGKLNDREKRDQLRARIEAGEKRLEARGIADRTRDAADTAIEFARKHPFATLAGAIGIGLAIGAMTRRGRALGRRGGSLANYAADAALAYGLSMLRGAGDRVEDFGDAAGTKARDLKRDATYRLDSMSDSLRSTGRKAGRKGSRTIRDLRSRFTN